MQLIKPSLLTNDLQKRGNLVALIALTSKWCEYTLYRWLLMPLEKLRMGPKLQNMKSSSSRETSVAPERSTGPVSSQVSFNDLFSLDAKESSMFAFCILEGLGGIEYTAMRQSQCCGSLKLNKYRDRVASWHHYYLSHLRSLRGSSLTG